MATEFRVVVLISGRGSNLKALLENQRDYTICGVISNNSQAGGLQLAREYNCPHRVIERATFPDLRSHKDATLKAVLEFKPDLVCLAGFMQILHPPFIEAFEGRLINIHPSLLPKYPGLDTHKRALEGGEKEHGCTVHFVDAGVDTGAVIVQARVEILANDTEDSLAARVLEKEHRIYPWVVGKIALREISLNNGAVKIAEGAIVEARESDFIT